MRILLRTFIWIGLLSPLVACGNGGGINFRNPAQAVTPTKPSAFNYVPASQAIVVQTGHTTATGYHGKLEYNPLGGQNMSGPGGVTAKMKFTARSR